MPLTFGTDAGVYPHGLNARQFGYMVRYGMTPMQALASATSEAAKALGRDDWARSRRAMSPIWWRSAAIR